MIQAADAFAKKNRRPASFQAILSYRYIIDFFHESHLRHLKEDEEKFSTFALFFHTKFQKPEIISLSIMFLFISNKYPFHYDARNESKKSETRTAM